MLKYLFLILSAIFFAGCGGNTYNHPAKSELHALIIPIENDEHKFNIFNESTIFIYNINQKEVSDMWESRCTPKRVIPGMTTLYVEEDQLKADFLFGAKLKFKAEAGEKYIINSKLKKENGKIVDIEFMIIHRGKIITKSKSEKIRKGTHIYVPIMI